ncbi:IclR family transcriptional regulator [Burkholderia sp. Ac-20379]|uniref:IclR family transcriptional regulator n=1 Tax=Burkholderia sp. Ac-20379 TaxID=2703900 RepID=UPI001F119E33|nr:IclR family transcriptional regulator [Burkholderia sp. Ac-20379]
MKEAADKPQRGIQSVEVAGRILEALARRREPAALSELAGAAALSTAQAHTYLVSLTRLGLVKRDALSGDYEPGPLSLRLGLTHVGQQPAYRVAVPHAAQLAERIGFSVAVCVPGVQGPMIVRYERGGYPLHVNLHVGTVMSLANTAIGRVFAAHLPDDVLDGLLVQEPIRLAGAPEIADAADARRVLTPALRARFERIRAAGLDDAFDAPVPGISTYAAPVFDHTRSIRLVLAVIGPSSRFERDAQSPIARALLAAAQRLSWRFGATGDATA